MDYAFRKQQEHAPLAVIAGDIHYSLSTLLVADAAVRLAIDKANELNVPFIANGDTHDSKANLRAECVNAMIETFKLCKVKPYINVGNHCKINSKSEGHALNFLHPFANVVDEPLFVDEIKSYIIPYYDNSKELSKYLKTIPENSRILIHQGILGSNSGDYFQDHSAIHKNELNNFRTIASHYHSRQDIECGRPQKGTVGLLSYIGNPYTLTFGEANDLPKGFQVLYDDGTLEFVPTNLRKHVIWELSFESQNLVPKPCPTINPEDLLWVKIHGTREQLARLTKAKLAPYVPIENYKLELIPTDNVGILTIPTNSVGILKQEELLDNIIANISNLTIEQQKTLQSLWRQYASN